MSKTACTCTYAMHDTDRCTTHLFTINSTLHLSVQATYIKLTTMNYQRELEASIYAFTTLHAKQSSSAF